MARLLHDLHFFFAPFKRLPRMISSNNLPSLEPRKQSPPSRWGGSNDTCDINMCVPFTSTAMSAWTLTSMHLQDTSEHICSSNPQHLPRPGAQIRIWRNRTTYVSTFSKPSLDASCSTPTHTHPAPTLHQAVSHRSVRSLMNQTVCALSSPGAASSSQGWCQGCSGL